jgi:hypothetical protein
MRGMLKDIKITRVANSQVAAQTAVTGTHVDMAGFTSVMFVALLGMVTDGCVLSLKAQAGSAVGDGDQTDLTNVTTGNLTASSSSNGVLVLDVVNPLTRYVRPVLGRTTQDAAVDGIFAIQYGPENQPTTQNVSVLLASQIVSPS